MSVVLVVVGSASGRGSLTFRKSAVGDPICPSSTLTLVDSGRPLSQEGTTLPRGVESRGGGQVEVRPLGSRGFGTFIRVIGTRPDDPFQTTFRTMSFDVVLTLSPSPCPGTPLTSRLTVRLTDTSLLKEVVSPESER